MRLALQKSSWRTIFDTGKLPHTIQYQLEQAFNLGTIKDARAVGMSSEIESLAEGKLADIVIFDALSPGMVFAASHDPVAAIVLHSSFRDVDTVIVDGIVRKES